MVASIGGMDRVAIFASLARLLLNTFSIAGSRIFTIDNGPFRPFSGSL